MVIVSRLINVLEFDMALIQNKDLYTQQKYDYLEINEENNVRRIYSKNI